jgi:L-ascorbate metabolism protein UlaG (beta-lactamase superfamily)
VDFLGHSSLLFQSTTHTVLIDPCFRWKRGLPAEVLDVARLKLDAVCISHSHWDHCNIETLLWLDKDTPILIPTIRHPTGFNPPIAPVLKNLGFTKIREVSNWESVSIGDIQFIPVPFHGEQEEPDIEMDHYTYVLKTEGLCLYGAVDASSDTFGDMKPVLERVYHHYKPDLAFLPIEKVTFKYRHGGANSYCRYIDNKLIDESCTYTVSAEEAAKWVSILRVKKVVPYAVFTFARWKTPVEIPEFSRALERLKLRDRLYPLRTLDGLSASDLNGSGRAEMRRKMLLYWFETGGRLLKSHRMMQRKSGTYRLFQRIGSKLLGTQRAI